MVEEEKQSRKHLDLARRIVETIANGEDQLSQQAVILVLKPFLV